MTAAISFNCSLVQGRSKSIKRISYLMPIAAVFQSIHRESNVQEKGKPKRVEQVLRANVTIIINQGWCVCVCVSEDKYHYRL